ncbi:class II fructose-bisphosphate aldolase [Marivita sp.]|jgi:fructose-bisphosphate aldolase class II|uniref:class II fructose-bisphosphate aldolase n=1 Tax=Marivita sp. TaxID=2003365 RepID=UPI0032193A38
MTRATLSEVLQPALRDGYAVAGLVCLGWEDARAYVAAAEAEGTPVILQAGPGARAHMPLPVWAAMFHALADGASVPVVSHLDHGTSIAECEEAIALGFTSVMFDGSRLPLDENIAQTRAITRLAHAAGVSCEGEIGFVGYAEGAASEGTDPDEAARFADATGVDAVAVSIGNVHLQTDQAAEIDRNRLARIEAVTDVPLVIHGGSGLPHDLRRDLAQNSTICKFNIGTELRMTFGAALREAVAARPDVFDRIALLSAVEDPLTQKAREVMRGLL